MARPVLHQFVDGATSGDAITDQALLLRRWLRTGGYRSHLFAAAIDPALEGEVHSYLAYRPSRPGEVVVLHHSIGSAVVEDLLARDVRFLLVYHNVTPPEFLAGVEPGMAAQLRRGREQLARVRERTLLALADSPLNRRELQAAGYRDTGLLPIALDPATYALQPSPALLAHYQEGGPNLIFVGRLVPNKRQEDLIKLLHACRRALPAARLFLVGAPWVGSYAGWLAELAGSLGLEDRVVMPGHVSQADLLAYYRLADLYVSMSEHEGFGKPLVESMHLGVPVLAFAAGAVEETLGGCGVLFRHKHYPALAELVDLLLADEGLRERLVARGRERAAAFLAPAVREQWDTLCRSHEIFDER